LSINNKNVWEQQQLVRRPFYFYARSARKITSLIELGGRLEPFCISGKTPGIFRVSSMFVDIFRKLAVLFPEKKITLFCGAASRLPIATHSLARQLENRAADTSDTLKYVVLPKEVPATFFA
jgi:hypothetical protein